MISLTPESTSLVAVFSCLLKSDGDIELIFIITLALPPDNLGLFTFALYDRDLLPLPDLTAFNDFVVQLLQSNS